LPCVDAPALNAQYDSDKYVMKVAANFARREVVEAIVGPVTVDVTAHMTVRGLRAAC
jgi:hypothetical protein